MKTIRYILCENEHPIVIQRREPVVAWVLTENIGPQKLMTEANKI